MTMYQGAIAIQDSSDADAVRSAESWIAAFGHVARHYRLPFSEHGVKLADSWGEHRTDRERLESLAAAAGLTLTLVDAAAVERNALMAPVIAWLADGSPRLAMAIGTDGTASIWSGRSGIPDNAIPFDQLRQESRAFLVVRPARAIPDRRVDDYIRPFEEHWLRRLLLQDARYYGHVVVASLISNCLALAGIIFSMQVYDRVIPAQSYPTLYILFGGVLLASAFSFLLRRLRMRIIDALGKRADLRISDRIFGHALRVRNDARPTATGTFISQLRDVDQIRELLTSTTVATIVDMPFFMLFAVILFSISGVLVLVPIGALFVLMAPGLFAQRRLRRHATESMREASLRNAMLVEAVQGLDDIKMLQAEHRFQSQWNHLNAVAAEAQLNLREVSSTLSSWTRSVQTAVYGTVVFVGAPMVMAGDITTGALVASSILSSRMMAPAAQLAQIFGRVQQARVAAKSLDRMMALPVDDPGDADRISATRLAGRYEVSSAVFHYGTPSAPPALTVGKLTVAPGEHIALLGRNGAGKSTLLLGLSGMMPPVSGDILLDGLALHHIDPADVRREIGLLSQQSRLFHGTIRDNLTLGAPGASDKQLLAALALAGAEDLIASLQAGFEHRILEGGKGLSGGQIQALLLARLAVRNPNIVLLDEPTASMDDATERHFIQRFARWSRGKTVIVATHRPRVLDLVGRVVVIHGGAIQLDKPKEDALRILREAAKRKQT